MRLSDDFSLDELTHSDTAIREDLDNTPGPAALANLQRLATRVLQPIRDLVGVPVHVHDGYRSAAVNAAVGGVPDSQHALGQAADIDALPSVTLVALFDAIRASAIPYDQVILEVTDAGGCVHVSCAAAAAAPRREALVRGGAPGRWTYTTLGAPA